METSLLRAVQTNPHYTFQHKSLTSLVPASISFTTKLFDNETPYHVCSVKRTNFPFNLSHTQNITTFFRTPRSSAPVSTSKMNKWIRMKRCDVVKTANKLYPVNWTQLSWWQLYFLAWSPTLSSRLACQRRKLSLTHQPLLTALLVPRHVTYWKGDERCLP